VSGSEPLRVLFVDTSTNHPDSWLWDFGDGSGSSEQNPEHQYRDRKRYTVTLTVTDDDGASDTKSHDARPGTQPSYFENATDYAINDNATVESPIAVSRTGNAPSALAVAVNIVHTYIGDLKVDLVAPDGSVYNLKATSSSDSADNVNTTYTKNLSSEQANGAWQLRVQDKAAQDTGYISTWTLTV